MSWFTGSINKVRGWMQVLFGMFKESKEIKDIIETQVSEDHYKNIDKWKEIYAGSYDEWSKEKVVTVNGTKTRRKHSLNMAKISANELSRLIFSENVEINISNQTHDENMKELFKQNRFYKIFQDKLETMFALGGLILKANPKEQPDRTHKLLISYVTPDCFIPISWESGVISEAAFLTITKKGDKTYCLFEIHKWNHTTVSSEMDEKTIVKLYTITNKLFEKDKSGSTAKEVSLSILYPELQPVVTIENLTQPLFQYIKPNIANNFDLQSPLGISLYANSLDTLFAIDVAFDSFIREFKLGRRRIIVPAQSVKSVIDPETGDMHRYFDADDEVYQAMAFADPEKQKIMDNTVPLRVDEHIDAINALLNLYAMQIGFSTGTFTFNGTQVKTATEVISENSKTYQTIKANENVLEEGLECFIRTLTEVADLYDIFPQPEGFEIEFNWDDSVIGDKYTDSDFFIKLLTNGLVSKSYVLQKILGLTKEQADKMMKESQEEQAAEMPDINDVLSKTNPLGGIKNG